MRGWWLDGWKDGCMVRWIDGCLHALMGELGELLNGWMNVYVFMCACFVLYLQE